MEKRFRTAFTFWKGIEKQFRKCKKRFQTAFALGKGVEKAVWEMKKEISN